jgi:hypothetical protein
MHTGQANLLTLQSEGEGEWRSKPTNGNLIGILFSPEGGDDTVLRKLSFFSRMWLEERWFVKRDFPWL